MVVAEAHLRGDRRAASPAWNAARGAGVRLNSAGRGRLGGRESDGFADRVTGLAGRCADRRSRLVQRGHRRDAQPGDFVRQGIPVLTYGLKRAIRAARLRSDERRDPVPPPHRAPEPRPPVARMGGLRRGQRLRRVDRHRVRGDPQRRGADRRIAAVQVPRLGAGRAATGRPGHHPRCVGTRARARHLHAVVRRGRQGHRRRHDRGARRWQPALDGGRSAAALVAAERRRPRRRDRRHQRGRGRGRPPGAARPGRARAPRPGRRGPTSATTAAGRGRSPGSTSTSAGPATPATSGTSSGWTPRRPWPCGTR